MTCTAVKLPDGGTAILCGPKPRAKKEMPAPLASIDCPYCHQQAPRTDGSFIYPNRPDLAKEQYFFCARCDAWVGCHPDGMPMGVLADAALRRARKYVHQVFDPLHTDVRDAYDGFDSAKIRGVARSRAYQWLAEQLGIEINRCHIAMFDIERCREAYRILRDRHPTPAEIRAWAKARKVEA